MSETPFARVERLFWSARELAPDARSAWLRDACGTDERLSREVSALLAAADHPAELDAPSADEIAGWLAPSDAGDLTGTRVGSCRLLRLIGQGGMGRVYEAEQTPPGRRVAVKLLREAFPDDRSRARFEHEARLVAAVEHPGVTRLFEVGAWTSPSGESVPYAVMELVEGGLPISVAARGLDTRARVALVAEVCDAVQACHTKGVLHRDLKSANILVGADGRPRVIDFGIARTVVPFHGGDVRTRTGAILGTPSHMSPEQLFGRPEDVDARSDVHALGVVLYEVLTGALPRDFGDGTLLETLRVMRERLPTPPERHDRRLRGDLSAVTLKAIDPDPERRYGTPFELSVDLRRWLDHMPVSARPAGWRRAIALWTRRHRALAVALVALVAALGAGAGVATYTAAQERRARAAADGQRARAEGFLRRSRDFVPWLLLDVQRRVAGLPGGRAAALDLTDGVRRHLEALADDETADPDMLLTASYSYLVLADIVSGAGPDLLRLPDQGARDLGAALDLAGRALAIRPNDVARDLVARAHLGRAQLALREGRDADGEASLAAARATVRRMAPGPLDTPYRRPFGVHTLLSLGEVDGLERAGRYDLAYEHCERAADEFEIDRAAGLASPAESLTIAFRQARASIRAGRAEAVESLRDRLRTAAVEYEAQEPAQGALAYYRYLVFLGDTTLLCGGSPEADLVLALGPLERWRRAVPGHRGPDREEAALRMRLGNCRLDRDDLDGAIVHLEAAAAITARLLAADPDDVGTTYNRVQSLLSRAEAYSRRNRDDLADADVAAAETVGATLRAAYPGDLHAAEGAARVPLTRAAIARVRAHRATDPADGRRLMEDAVRLQREGVALYADAARRFPGHAPFTDTLARCRAEVDRFERELTGWPGG